MRTLNGVRTVRTRGGSGGRCVRRGPRSSVRCGWARAASLTLRGLAPVSPQLKAGRGRPCVRCGQLLGLLPSESTRLGWPPVNMQIPPFATTLLQVSAVEAAAESTWSTPALVRVPTLRGGSAPRAASTVHHFARCPRCGGHSLTKGAHLQFRGVVHSAQRSTPCHSVEFSPVR